MVVNTKKPDFILTTFHILIFFLFFFPNYGCFYNNDNHVTNEGKEEQPTVPVGVGIVGNIDSPFGRMMSLCMDMAVSDFYASQPHHRASLRLRKEHAESVLDLNLAGKNVS